MGGTSTCHCRVVEWIGGLSHSWCAGCGEMWRCNDVAPGPGKKEGDDFDVVLQPAACALAPCLLTPVHVPFFLYQNVLV